MSRITARFRGLRERGRAALVTFVTAGDPDYATSLEIVKALPGAGADLLEIGMPFSDPMAEGPPVQASSRRALLGGQTMARTLELVRAFRAGDDETPVVLMGYYNPILSYGVPRFLAEAKTAGVDGLIVVDLPPEEDEELCWPARDAGIDFIRLATPTTDARRLPRVIEHASGFLYYVSILGITGSASPDMGRVEAAVAKVRAKTTLPVAVGFGVKTAAQARDVARFADGAVVGSALVNAVRDSLDEQGRATPDTVPAVVGLVSELAAGVREARAEQRMEA